MMPDGERLQRILPLLSALALLCVSCDRDTPPTANSPEARVGGALFGSAGRGFDHERITVLEISKNDPADEDRWSARLVRRSPSADWEIASAPEGRELLDRRADSGFVLHLLDTLRTLQIVDAAPNGPLESFGLNPPFYLLRWVDDAGTIREVRIGAPVSGKTDRRYASLPDTGPSQRQGEGKGKGNRVWIVDGAALQMLAHLRSFETLRGRTLVTLASDDVDELSVHEGRASKPALHALRSGEGWVDAGDQKLRGPISEWLEALTHARVRQFIDDPRDAKRWAHQANRAPLYRATLKDREGRATEVSVARAEGRVVATVSTREGAVFELFPESVRLFRPPARR